MKTFCSRCFRTLGVGSRARIYSFLENGIRKNVAEITKYAGLKQPTVSYHLKEMKKAGLLTRSVRGKRVYYSVSKSCPHDGRKCVVS